MAGLVVATLEQANRRYGPTLLVCLLVVGVLVWLAHRPVRPHPLVGPPRARRVVVPPGHSEAFHRYGKLSCPPCQDPSWVEVKVQTKVQRPDHHRIPTTVVRLDEDQAAAIERTRRRELGR